MHFLILPLSAEQKAKHFIVLRFSLFIPKVWNQLAGMSEDFVDGFRNISAPPISSVSASLLTCWENEYRVL